MAPCSADGSPCHRRAAGSTWPKPGSGSECNVTEHLENTANRRIPLVNQPVQRHLTCPYGHLRVPLPPNERTSAAIGSPNRLLSGIWPQAHRHRAGSERRSALGIVQRQILPTAHVCGAVLDEYHLSAGHDIRQTMPKRKCRFVLLRLFCLLQGCGPQVVAPQLIEKEVLERALADNVAKNDICLIARIGPLAEGPNYWPFELSFEDGKGLTGLPALRSGSKSMARGEAPFVPMRSRCASTQFGKGSA